MRSPGPVKVVSVSLDEPLRAVARRGPRYVGVLLVVLSHGTVVGSSACRRCGRSRPTSCAG